LDALIRDARANHAVGVNDLGEDRLVVEVGAVDVLLVASVLGILAAEAEHTETRGAYSQAKAEILAALDLRLEHIFKVPVSTQELGLHFRASVEAWAKHCTEVLVTATGWSERSDGFPVGVTILNSVSFEVAAAWKAATVVLHSHVFTLSREYNVRAAKAGAVAPILALLHLLEVLIVSDHNVRLKVERHFWSSRLHLGFLSFPSSRHTNSEELSWAQVLRNRHTELPPSGAGIDHLARLSPIWHSELNAHVTTSHGFSLFSGP